MRFYRTYVLFLGFILFSPCLFAGCGQADMNRAIQQLLFEAQAYYKAPGVQISVICPGESVPHDFVSGYADIEKKIPMGAQHLVQIGSQTKLFVSAIILQLESEGKLSIHDPIGRYLKNLPSQWQSVTIQQLLNHTSGLPDYLNAPQFLEVLEQSEGTKEWTYEELVEFVKATPPNFQPGNGWNYAQINYLLAGRVVEEVTQNSFESELNTRILSPLHLTDTVYHPGPYMEEILNRMAHGYSEYGLFPREPKDITGYNLSFLGPAGAMLSTAHDNALWFKALLKTHILPPFQEQELKQLVDIGSGQFLPGSSSKIGYALGMGGQYTSFLGPTWGGVGKTLGYSTGTFYLECQDLVISYTVNHVGKLENEQAYLFRFKIINVLQRFVPKKCSNVKGFLEARDAELFGDMNFDAFDKVPFDGTRR